MSEKPMTWNEIAGHGPVKEYLKRAAARGRISHAYAFVGPKGTGKATTARVFAMALFCSSKEPGQACGVCRDCRRVARGLHPDLHWVVPDNGSVRIEQMRELQGELMLKPFEAARKVAVIDDGDLMTTAAQNSLLKLLEEPPGTTTVIVVASNPSSLLTTIRSRCQMIRFQPLPVEEVANELVKRGVGDANAQLIAAMTEGRLGLAISSVARDIVALRDRVAEWVGELADDGRGVSAIIRVGMKLEEERERLDEYLDLFLLWLRDLLLLKEGLTQAIANQDAIRHLNQQLNQVERAGLVQAMREIDGARRRLRGNANFRLTVDSMLTNVRRSFVS